jgi:hypothetical protein
MKFQNILTLALVAIFAISTPKSKADNLKLSDFINVQSNSGSLQVSTSLDPLLKRMPALELKKSGTKDIPSTSIETRIIG